MATSTTRLLRTKALNNTYPGVYSANKSSLTDSLQWLSSCKNADLKRIANAIGSNTGGTKAVLAANLQRNLQQDRFPLLGSVKSRDLSGADHNIVSIDMGIRNLAYCRMSLPPGWASTAQPAVAVVHEWSRIVVSKPANAESSTENTEQRAPKEAFDPATYAKHACSLVKKLLSAPQPTQILIERQRFRSMGGSAVQEWTLRVNMFEAMLYAVLETLSEQGSWHGAVHPVAPAKVSNFWLGEVDTEPRTKSGPKSLKTKAAKIDVVTKWLEDGNCFQLRGAAAKLGQAFLKKRKGAKRVLIEQNSINTDASGPHFEVEMGKLDDLADCMLQGMAWVQWEKNRRIILDGGLQALHDL